MKNFHVTVMSIDPNGDEEDNHQKYGKTIVAETEEKAKIKFKEDFKLPIFWIKATEIK